MNDRHETVKHIACMMGTSAGFVHAASIDILVMSKFIWVFFFTCLESATHLLSVKLDMRGSRKFFQTFSSWLGERGSKYHYKRVIIWPPAKGHLNGVSLACRWWLDSFVIFRGSGPVLLKKTYILWFFMGGGVRTLCPPFWIRPCRKANPRQCFHDVIMDFIGVDFFQMPWFLVSQIIHTMYFKNWARTWATE